MQMHALHDRVIVFKHVIFTVDLHATWNGHGNRLFKYSLLAFIPESATITDLLSVVPYPRQPFPTKSLPPLLFLAQPS